jgi:Skp family chaperone for outer membrane proteins
MTDKLLLGLLAAAAPLASFSAAPAAAQNRLPAAVVAVVDTDRVYSECTACRAAVTNQVMTQRGANVAVDTNATLARANSVDITNDVLAQLNQQLPSVSVTPLPQQQQPAQQQPTGR